MAGSWKDVASSWWKGLRASFPRPLAGQATTSTLLLAEHVSAGEGIKVWLMEHGSWIVPLLIMFLSTISTGYLFANLQPFSLSSPTIFVAYLSGGVLEFVELISNYTANYHLKRKNMALFGAALSLALVFAGGSVLAQIVYLSKVTTVQDVNVTVPVLSWLIGFSGGAGMMPLYIARAVLLHVAEIGCTFIISRREASAAEIAKRQQEHALLEAQAQTTRATTEIATQVNRVVVEQLGTVGQMMSVMTASMLEQLQRQGGQDYYAPLDRPRLLRKEEE